MVEFAPQRLPVRIHGFIAGAAAAHGVTITEVLSSSHCPRCVAGRRAAALALHASGFSLAEIGGYLNRHHTSILSLIGRRGVRAPILAVAAEAPPNELDLSGEWV